ncbi:MAG: hypothetical protein ACUVXJ_08130 [Phycisphaerae bacterium]
MHLDSSRVTINGKTYTRHLLRESYRENGKVKHRIIANISNGLPAEIEAIRLALRHKDELQELVTAAAVRLPEVVPSHGVTVSTKRTLAQRRRKH